MLGYSENRIINPLALCPYDLPAYTAYLCSNGGDFINCPSADVRSLAEARNYLDRMRNASCNLRNGVGFTAAFKNFEIGSPALDTTRYPYYNPECELSGGDMLVNTWVVVTNNVDFWDVNWPAGNPILELTDSIITYVEFY